VITVGFLVTIGVCITFISSTHAEAGPAEEDQLQQHSRKGSPKTGCPSKKPKANKENSSRMTRSPIQHSGPRTQHSGPRTQHSGPRTQHSGPRTQHPGPRTQHPGLSTQDPAAPRTQQKLTPKPKRKASTASSKLRYHGTFVATLKSAPFPYSGKGVDLNFFDFIDPRTGERFRTTRTLERLSEKDHYCDSSVLFYVPSQFNPRKPFSYVVFFHGNRTEVRHFFKDYLLDEQTERSGKNVILVLPQLAKNAADSSPGKFSKRDAFRVFMFEVAQVLTSRLGKQYRRQLEQASIILVAFSGGYKPLACTLDRGGTDSRTTGVMLLDALYDDLYIFGNWILKHARRGFFVNISSEDSLCEEKTRILAQFLRTHHLAFKEEWPKRLKRGHICLMRSPNDHLQIPIAGPPREPLTQLLRNLTN
jgi:hypothetical protein